MANATGFHVDLNTMDIRMNRGDTGSFKIGATRESGTAWTSDDRMLFTVRNSAWEIVMQRFYRLDDQWGLGNGVVLVEFHNDDTDKWSNGVYDVEVRYNIDPVWTGTAPEGRCVNALTAGVSMIEGDVVRTRIHSTLTIEEIYGEV